MSATNSEENRRFCELTFGAPLAEQPEYKHMACLQGKGLIFRADYVSATNSEENRRFCELAFGAPLAEQPAYKHMACLQGKGLIFRADYVSATNSEENRRFCELAFGAPLAEQPAYKHTACLQGKGLICRADYVSATNSEEKRNNSKMKIGFDNEKYLKLQSKHIMERIGQFGDKLYLEFGGKLFDDYHASRVLPGFSPDSKLQMLMQLSDCAEIVIVISATDIEKNKVRGDLGITYDVDVLRLREEFLQKGLYVGSVVITHYSGQNSADQFKAKLEKKNIKVYLHYTIEGYPANVPLIVSENGYGRNEYIETARPLVVITAPGPGSGKMATCLSQLYHDNLRGIKAGYAKFETFPIWNIPLKHPINLAYEAATADLNDVNMIDPFHLEAYGETAVNYNRDIEIFPVLNAIFEGIYGSNPYKSPTDMGVNMAGNCIVDDDICCHASNMEIIRRYYATLNKVIRDEASDNEVYKIELLMKQAKISTDDRHVTLACKQRAEKLGVPTAAIELPDGEIITSKTSDFLGASAALLLNALKHLAGIDHDQKLIQPDAIEPIQDLKVRYLGGKNPRLHTDEVLIALSLAAATDTTARHALEQLPNLKGCQVHTSVMLSEVDIKIYKRLGVDLTSEPVQTTKKRY